MTRRGKAVLKEAGGMMGRAGRGKERSGEGEGGEGEEGGPLVGSERSLCSEEGGVPSKVLWERFQTKKRKKRTRKNVASALWVELPPHCWHQLLHF